MRFAAFHLVCLSHQVKPDQLNQLSWISAQAFYLLQSEDNSEDNSEDRQEDTDFSPASLSTDKSFISGLTPCL